MGKTDEPPISNEDITKIGEKDEPLANQGNEPHPEASPELDQKQRTHVEMEKNEPKEEEKPFLKEDITKSGGKENNESVSNEDNKTDADAGLCSAVMETETEKASIEDAIIIETESREKDSAMKEEMTNKHGNIVDAAVEESGCGSDTSDMSDSEMPEGGCHYVKLFCEGAVMKT